MNKNNFQINKLKSIDFLAVCLFFIGVFSFLFFTGALNSGYHFTDDHEIIRINADLENTSFLETSANWLKSDLNIRFRPMYYLHRIFEIKIFGSDFLLLSLYTGLLASLTFYFFYFGARKLRYTVFESLLFVFLAFVGSQAVIWWRLGPAETIGVFFLGLSFLFMARCTEKHKYLLNTVLFNIFLILASLSKESFAIIIPAFVLYKVWSESKVFEISVKKSIKNNYLSVFTLVVMSIEIWIIVFVIGTNKIGYAGSTSSGNELTSGIIATATSKDMLLGWFELIAVFAVFYLAGFLFVGFSKFVFFRQSIKNIFAPLSFSLLMLLPNIILYAKSGMTERYLLPATLGLSFLIIYMLKNINNFIFHKIAIVIIVVSVAMSFDVAIKIASAFASEGMQTNELLSAIADHAGPNSKILLAADPVNRYEVSFSIKTYFSSKGINDLYGYPIKREYVSDFERGLEQGWEKWFEGKTIGDISGQPDIILIFDKNQSEIFFAQSNLPKSNYNNILGSNSPHAVYMKNNPT